MKTVSTKLDNKLHNEFMTLCNDEGKCQSEFLRDLIETLCEDCSDEENDVNQPQTSQDLEIKVEAVEPEPITTEPVTMAHGKILDDFGNIIGTF